MLFAIIFSIIGLYFGGLGGAFGGFLIGSIFDSIRNNLRAKKAQEEFNRDRQQYYNDPEQFEEQMLTLIGYVAKADNNRLLQSEFDYCKKYFQETFPHSDLSQLMLKFRDILNSEDIADACREACGRISQYATIHEKIAILQCLFGFATADGNVHQNEVEAIHRISSWCGVNEITYEAIKLLYMSSSYTGGYSGDSHGGGYSGGYGGGYSGGYGGSTYQPRSGPSLDECYKILEVSPNATDDEVKKAYRTAAMKYHPDKVSHLGEDVRKKAEEQFAKVNEAYDKIKAARGMK
ncbi:MAG: DnaJ domain-containing protein [Bacteroidales bacterium]|nr:DnaJ domain-containing protein [Bacteroidales bacterium]